MPPAPQPTAFVAENYDRDSAGYFLGAKVISLLHRFYHHEQDDFDARDEDYQQSLIILGIGVVGLAAVLMVCFILSMVAACGALSSREARTASCCLCFTRKTGFATLFIIFLAASACATCSIIGREEFYDAADEIHDSLDTLAERFLEMEGNVDELIDYGTQLEDAAADTDCSPNDITENLENAVSEYSDAVTQMDGYLEGIAKKIQYGADFVHDKLRLYITLGVRYVLAAIWGVSALAIVSMFTTCCSFDDIVTTVIAIAVMLALAGLIAMELTISVALSDFCFKGPDTALLLAAENAGLKGNALELTTYYLTCDGENPLEPPINATVNELRYINATTFEILNGQSTYVCDDEAVETMAQLALLVVLDLISEVSCQLINPLYTSIFYGVICDEFVRGLFVLWTVQAASGVILYTGFCIFPYASHPVRKIEKKAEFGDFDTPSSDELDHDEEDDDDTDHLHVHAPHRDDDDEDLESSDLIEMVKLKERSLKEWSL